MRFADRRISTGFGAPYGLVGSFDCGDSPQVPSALRLVERVARVSDVLHPESKIFLQAVAQELPDRRRRRGGEDGVRQLQTDVTTDAGTAFEGSIEFRPLTGEALTGRFGVMKGALVTGGDEQNINVTLRQDFGSTDAFTQDTSCAANDRVVDLDNLSVGDAETLHLIVGDAASVTDWTLDQFHLQLSGGAS
jgi:hypothetical protein